MLTCYKNFCNRLLFISIVTYTATPFMTALMIPGKRINGYVSKSFPNYIPYSMLFIGILSQKGLLPQNLPNPHYIAQRSMWFLTEYYQTYKW